MRRLPLVIVAALVMALAWSVLPVHGQDIYGLSFRPTDAMGDFGARGKVDMVEDGDGFLVSVDLSGAAEGLKIEKFTGAAAFVVWWVDMDGKRHSLGTLNDALVLDDARADALIAKLFLTAEADAATAQPTGDRLYEVTLRNVAEVETTAGVLTSKDTAKVSAAAGTTPTEAAKPTGAAAAKPTEAPKPTEAAKAGTETKKTEAKPGQLPTTGSAARDLLVLLAVVAGLVISALRLRAVRV
jgi:hypothetical protein